jgi:hypothetical protein
MVEATTTELRAGVEQALPTPGGASVFASLRARGVQAMLDEREQKGIATYGRSLETHNGRDVFLDALQEQLDGLVYLEQARMEHTDLLAEVARLRLRLEAASHAECATPPDGWTCSRGAGHEGPCAASERQ